MLKICGYVINTKHILSAKVDYDKNTGLATLNVTVSGELGMTLDLDNCAYYYQDTDGSLYASSNKQIANLRFATIFVSEPAKIDNDTDNYFDRKEFQQLTMDLGLR